MICFIGICFIREIVIDFDFIVPKNDFLKFIRAWVVPFRTPCSIAFIMLESGFLMLSRLVNKYSKTIFCKNFIMYLHKNRVRNWNTTGKMFRREPHRPFYIQAIKKCQNTLHDETIYNFIYLTLIDIKFPRCYNHIKATAKGQI